MIRMTRADILPAVMECRRSIAESINEIRQADPEAETSYEKVQLVRLSGLVTVVWSGLLKLEKALVMAKAESDPEKCAAACRNDVISAMNELRIAVDEMETVTARKYWPYPTYGELLFGVK